MNKNVQGGLVEQEKDFGHGAFKCSFEPLKSGFGYLRPTGSMTLVTHTVSMHGTHISRD